MLDYTFHASSGAAVEWYFHDDDARISTPDRDRLSQLAVDVLADSGADGGIVSISLADPDIMAGLNADHMGVDAPTDVLSFHQIAPYGQVSTISRFPRALSGSIITMPSGRR